MVSFSGGPTIRVTRSPPGTSASTAAIACRKLATVPAAESIKVPSRSKITNSGVSAAKDVTRSLWLTEDPDCRAAGRTTVL